MSCRYMEKNPVLNTNSDIDNEKKCEVEEVDIISPGMPERVLSPFSYLDTSFLFTLPLSECRQRLTLTAA